MPDVVAAHEIPGQAVEEIGGLGDVVGGAAGEGKGASNVIVGGGEGTAVVEILVTRFPARRIGNALGRLISECHDRSTPE